uniref:Uncharacterized protein n=1 Tax=Plectus sambesii TaxID=2011161 RepID=A0A914VBN7_9BILA
LPGLFRGCQFHIFGNPRRYQVPGCATKDLMERLIKLGEGQLLSREPNIDSWKLNPVLPYYATRDSASGREFAECGQFLVYMPGERMPPKRVFDSPVNFITPMWFLDSISKFELVHPDTRPVFNPSSSW